MTVTFYCRCGASWTGRATDAQAQVRLAQVWRQAHTGAGHGYATAVQARQARSRTERKEPG